MGTLLGFVLLCYPDAYDAQLCAARALLCAVESFQNFHQ